MNNMGETFTAVFTAVIGLAIVAVIFSSRSQSSAVIKSAGDAFQGILGVAVSPITGSGGGNGGAFAGGGGSGGGNAPSINVGQFGAVAQALGTVAQALN